MIMDFFFLPNLWSYGFHCSTLALIQYIILLIWNYISLIFPFNYVPLMNHFMDHKYNCKHWLYKFLLKISLYNMLTSKDCFSCLTGRFIIHFYRKPFSHNFFFLSPNIVIICMISFHKEGLYSTMCVCQQNYNLWKLKLSLLSYYASKTDPEHLRDLSSRF